MTLSSREIEEIHKEPFKKPRFTGFFVGLLRFIAKIPYIRNKINNSVGGLSGSIFKCWEKKDYKQATEISIFALERFRHKKGGPAILVHHHWWEFMKYGVQSAKHIDDSELKNKLISLANEGIKPYEGYNVAYSYLECSLWKYDEHNYEEAINYAKVAANADITWAEPEFILGWYSLVLSLGNAEEHLSNAIERDQRVLFRIANNETCKQYPHVINKLKAKYQIFDESNSIDKINSADRLRSG
jgi:hypothetical protein